MFPADLLCLRELGFVFFQDPSLNRRDSVGKAEFKKETWGLEKIGLG